MSYLQLHLFDLFDNVRKTCPRIDSLNDENKFLYLLNSSGSTIKNVAIFVHSAFTANSSKTLKLKIAYSFVNVCLYFVLLS